MRTGVIGAHARTHAGSRSGSRGSMPVRVRGPGDPPGRRQFVTVASEQPLALRAGGRLGPITVAYETWGTLDADTCNAVLVLHALTGDSHAAGRRGARSRRGRAGGTRSIGPGARDRHRPVLRGVPQRARRLPGHDRSGVDRSRRPAGRTARGSRRSRSAIRSRWRPLLADALGIERWAAVVGGSMGGQRALEWAVDVPRAGPARGDHRVRRGRDRRADRRCARCRSARSRPTRTSTAATTTTPTGGPVARPRRSRAASARSATAPSSSSRSASTAATRTTSTRSRAASTRSSRTSSTTARSSPGASTPTPTSCCHGSMNHHDVGRGRSGVRGRARPHHRPGHDRRHLLRPAVPDAPARGARRADPQQLGRARDRLDVGPRRVPHRARDGRQDHRRCPRVLLDHLPEDSLSGSRVSQRRESRGGHGRAVDRQRRARGRAQRDGAGLVPREAAGDARSHRRRVARARERVRGRARAARCTRTSTRRTSSIS